ncbi:hypothetical protein [Sulfurimonas sp. CS5]|uniref:hypothetical protein n=1 Tax=Sulfurimonas sp. CS5 TaxID=3391145 RepID=UPI0039EB6DE2
MIHIGSGIFIIAGLVIFPRILNYNLPSEAWLFFSSLIIGSILIKMSKINKQSDILIIGLLVALTLTLPILLREHIEYTLIRLIGNGFGFFISTYIGLVIPLYLVSYLKNLTKHRSE